MSYISKIASDSLASDTCVQSHSILADDKLKPQDTQPTREDTRGFLESLGFVVLPVAPRQESNPKQFSGKNPSYSDIKRLPHTVKWKEFENGKQPSDRVRSDWFRNPENGLGVLFNNSNNIYGIDIDVKNFDSQNDCNSFVSNFLAEFPQVKNWVEKTRSGGYRIFIRLKNEPGFKNFKHKSSEIKRIGELLGSGCFAVLAPTKDYQVINRPEKLEDIPEFESAEELGIFKSGIEKPEILPQKVKSPVGESNFENLPTTQVTFEKLISQNNLTTFKGIYSENDDKSSLFTSLIKDVYGWDNWIQKNFTELLIENPRDFIDIAGDNFGYDSSKVERVLDTVITSECLPAIHYVGGDEACRKKISALTNTRKPFEVLTTIEETILLDTFGDGKGDWKVLYGAFIRYTGKGYWEIIEDPEIEKLICQDLRLCHSYKKTKEGHIKEFKYSTEKNKVACLKFCRSALIVKQSSNNLRCFADVTVDFTSGEILQHSKEHYLTSVIPFKFIENADCPQVFLDFIGSSYGLELLQLIRAILSMMLDPKAPYGYFPHLIGESGSGKGTLLRLIEKLFDEKGRTTPTTLDIFNNPDKAHQFLAGKAICLFKDLQGFQSKLGGFYEVIDNGAIACRPLFSNHSYSVSLNLRVIIASVSQLNLENAAEGLARRIIPIPTKPVRNRPVNPNLEQDLEAELANIISWALAIDKKERNDLIVHSSKLEAVAKMKKEQEIASNPVMGFADCSILPSPGSTVSINELYSCYQVFCNRYGFKPLSIFTFSKRTKQIFPDNYIESSIKRVNGDVKRVPACLDNAALSNAFQNNGCGEFICTPDFLIPGCLDLFKYEQEKPKIEQPTEQPKQTEIDKKVSEIRENWKNPIEVGRIILGLNVDTKKEIFKKMTTPEMQNYWHKCVREFEKYNNLTDAEILGFVNSVNPVDDAEDF